MTFLELVKKRYSCRDFSNKPVDKEKIMQVLAAAQVAPTAVNKQPQRLIVVQETEGLTKLAKAVNVHNAPVVIIVCGDTASAWTRGFDKKNVTDVDIAIVTDHMMLQATALGLNSLWACYFDPEVLKKEFNIPAHYSVLNVLALGYGQGLVSSPTRHETARNSIDSFVFYEKM